MTGGIALSLFLGIIGGAICGAAILTFGVFIGRSGTTGDYFGHWEPAAIPIGLFYGGLFGAVAGLLAYPLIRTTGFRRSVLPAFLGTIVGGFLGEIASPLLAVIMGICGFFVALFLTRIKQGQGLKT